jgi:hypothetical protein
MSPAATSNAGPRGHQAAARQPRVLVTAWAMERFHRRHLIHLAEHAPLAVNLG